MSRIVFSWVHPFEQAGKDTEGMFGESAFVPRRTAEKWVAEARQEQAKLTPPEPWPRPRTAGQEYAARMRSRDLSKPVLAEEPEDITARDKAFARRFEAATPEQQAAMIVEAAARSRPKKK